MESNHHGKEENKAAGETARGAGAVQIYPQPLRMQRPCGTLGRLERPCIGGGGR